MSFKGALQEIRRQCDEESLDWLQGKAFRIEKQLLSKMAHHKNNWRMFWDNSLCKFNFRRQQQGQPRATPADTHEARDYGQGLGPARA